LVRRRSDGGFGNLRGLVIDRSGFVAKRVASEGIFQFGDGADIAGVEFAYFGQDLFPHHLGMLHALGNSLPN
jgi:hypothetical protein